MTSSKLYHVPVTIRLLTTAADLALYDAWVKNHPLGTLWQSLEWKAYQEALGRQVRVYAGIEDEQIVASALVVIDRTAFGLSTWDIAKGPLSDNTHVTDLLNRIEQDAHSSQCLSLSMSPGTPLPSWGRGGREGGGDRQWKQSRRHEHPSTTRILDLTQPEDSILAQMHQKGRYNIRVAERHGVQVRQGTTDDVPAFYKLLKGTAGRDGFGIHPQAHYGRFLTDLKNSFFLLATHERKTVAGLLGVTWNNTGFYYYGASDHGSRALMAPYLLQWEAMKYSKEQGCATYDLLGIAPPDAGLGHPWQGISSFKEKFGGTVVTYPPEQQLILKPLMNTLLHVKRKVLG